MDNTEEKYIEREAQRIEEFYADSYKELEEKTNELEKEISHEINTNKYIQPKTGKYWTDLLVSKIYPIDGKLRFYRAFKVHLQWLEKRY
jgi:hypothetical protein